jgi:dienelactone hydrolase
VAFDNPRRDRIRDQGPEGGSRGHRSSEILPQCGASSWQKPDRRIKAVSEYYGGLGDDFPEHVTPMPPVLILHDDADKGVPVSAAYRRQSFLERVHAPCEMKIYSGADHIFDGNGDTPAGIDAWQRTLAFFDRYLSKSPK